MIQVIHRALDILEFIAKNPNKSHSLTEVATHLNLNQGTCANIMKTLVSRNYLSQIVRKKGYQLGSMAYHLTENYLFKDEFVDVSKNVLKKISQQLNEGSILTILSEDNRIVIHEEKSTHELQVVNLKSRKAYSTSTGRVILANMERSKIFQFVIDYGLPKENEWPEVKSEVDLMNELENIRKNGFCKQIAASHVIGYAAPIFNSNNIIGAVGIYLPQSRMKLSKQEALIKLLLNSVVEIEQQLELKLKPLERIFDHKIKTRHDEK